MPSPSFAVLFVDDEAQSRKYFRLTLADHYDILLAENADEAMALLASEGERIGVIVADQRMPGKSGVELLRHIRENYPDIERILTTAYTDLQDAIDGVNSGGIRSYINKPWDLAQVKRDIDDAMASFETERARNALLAEKLSVRAMEHVTRAVRDVILITCTSSDSRFRADAIQALLNDLLPDCLEGIEVLIDDNWSLATHSLMTALALASALTHWRATNEAFTTPLDGMELRTLMQDVVGKPGWSITTDTNTDHILVCLPVLQRVLDALTALSTRRNEPVSAHIGPDKAGGLTITIDGLEWSPSVACADGALIDVYLGVYHHGGTVNASCADQRMICWLPAQPSACDSPAPGPDSLNWLPDWLSEAHLLLTTDA